MDLSFLAAVVHCIKYCSFAGDIDTWEDQFLLPAFLFQSYLIFFPCIYCFRKFLNKKLINLVMIFLGTGRLYTVTSVSGKCSIILIVSLLNVSQ